MKLRTEVWDKISSGNLKYCVGDLAVFTGVKELNRLAVRPT